MIQLEGKYCRDCRIFTDDVEDEAMKLIQSMLEQKAFEGVKVRIMPDVHLGNGITIGFSAPLGKWVNPGHVGVDIGCTISSMELSRPVPEDCYPEFESLVKTIIPTGFHINEKEVINRLEFLCFLENEYKTVMAEFPDMIHPVDSVDITFINSLLKRIGMNAEQFFRSLPSLGGGNHFLEYGVSEDGRAFFTAHCGSRNLGVKVCGYWSAIAQDWHRTLSKHEHHQIVETVKASCPDKTKWRELILEKTGQMEDERFMKNYLSGDNLKGYLSDMVIAQAYARFNHMMIHRLVAELLESRFGISIVKEIYTTHNYIDFKDHPMIRKGAVRAYRDELCIIPFNMRDGLAICRGKSNPDWNYTAPHGAGRILSRSAAKQQLSMDDFRKTMSGIYSTTVCPGTIDEAPMAYKPMEEIVRLTVPTIDILFFVKPRINIKATEEDL